MEHPSSPNHEPTAASFASYIRSLHEQQKIIQAAAPDTSTMYRELERHAIVANYDLAQNGFIDAYALVSDPYLESDNGDAAYIDFQGHAFSVYKGVCVEVNYEEDGKPSPVLIHMFEVTSLYGDHLDEPITTTGILPIESEDITLLRQGERDVLLSQTQSLELHAMFQHMIRRHAFGKDTEWLMDNINSYVPLDIQDARLRSSEVVIKTALNNAQYTRGQFKRTGMIFGFCGMSDPTHSENLDTSEFDPPEIILGISANVSNERHHALRLAEVPLRSCMSIEAIQTSTSSNQNTTHSKDS